MRRLNLALVLAAAVASMVLRENSPARAGETRPALGPMRCYFGVMHSHSVLSPDFEPQPADREAFRALVAGTGAGRFELPNGPYLAWKRAAEQAKLDFLALTDHLHGPEGAGTGTCAHEMPPGGYRLLVDAAERINTEKAGAFLAIPGIEWSTISSGNHVNILFARSAVPDDIPNGDFRALLNRYVLAPDQEQGNPHLLVQLNHPNQNGGRRTINYGRGAFPPNEAGTQQFVSLFGPIYAAIEHVNNSRSGNENTSETNDHQDGNTLNAHYNAYLNMGLRLAPVAGHDNHRPNWGRHTAARTGVWARSLGRQHFVDAYRSRRMFATEDKELAVRLRVGNYWMGSNVPIADGGATRGFAVRVEQMPDTDTGVVQNEGPYTLELIADDDGPGGEPPRPVSFTYQSQQRQSISVTQGVTVSFKRFMTPGSYCYVHVVETNGQDAGGADADAWTAPIFFVTEQ